MSGGDVLMTFAILLLFVEMVKVDPHRHRRTVVDHGLSLMLLLAMLVEFVLVKQAASATFFLLAGVELLRRARRLRVDAAFGAVATW